MRKNRRERNNNEIKLNSTIIRVQKPSIKENMNNHQISGAHNTRHGLIKIDEKEYYFSANRNSIFPIVFGATNIEQMLEVKQLLDNKMKECGSNDTFFKTNLSKENILNMPNVYFDELDKGILIVKKGKHYFGYMPGKSGCRAISYRKGEKPYSCSVKSLIKDLDRPGKQSFRQMASQGNDINNMIVKLMEIVKILDDRNFEPKENKRAKRNKQSVDSEEIKNDSTLETAKVEVKEIIKEEQPKRTRRGRRTAKDVIDKEESSQPHDEGLSTEAWI